MKKLNLKSSIGFSTEAVQQLKSLSPLVEKVHQAGKTTASDYLVLKTKDKLLKIVSTVEPGIVIEEEVPVDSIVFESEEDSKQAGLGFNLDLVYFLNNLASFGDDVHFCWDKSKWAIESNTSDDYVCGTLIEAPFFDEQLDDILNRFDVASSMNSQEKFSFSFDENTERAFDTVPSFRVSAPSCNGIWVSKSSPAVEVQGIPYGSLKLNGSINYVVGDETTQASVDAVPFHIQAGDIFRQARSIKKVPSINMEVFVLDDTTNPVCNFVSTLGTMRICVQSLPSGQGYLPLNQEDYCSVNASKVDLPTNAISSVLAAINIAMKGQKSNDDAINISINPETYNESAKTLRVDIGVENSMTQIHRIITGVNVQDIECLGGKTMDNYLMLSLLPFFAGKAPAITMSFDSESSPTEDEQRDTPELARHKMCIAFETETSKGLLCKFEA